MSSHSLRDVDFFLVCGKTIQCFVCTKHCTCCYVRAESPKGTVRQQKPVNIEKVARHMQDCEQGQVMILTQIQIIVRNQGACYQRVFQRNSKNRIF